VTILKLRLNTSHLLFVNIFIKKLLIMLFRIYKSIMFRLLSIFTIRQLSNCNKVIYLTFDDGPEPNITEFIIHTLNRYNAKATFFCTGHNFEKYPDLVELIKNNGHTFGNHTYSHIDGLKVDSKTYIDEVNRTKKIIQTNLFRPPWGALSIRNFLKIRKNNKIIMWDISSSDTIDNTKWDKICHKMIKKTRPGSIILFHFSLEHALGTKQILPLYVDKIYKLGYNFESINI
jgi:peptidoglycan-N-acetylglucosamine deacetylase